MYIDTSVQLLFCVGHIFQQVLFDITVFWHYSVGAKRTTFLFY